MNRIAALMMTGLVLVATAGAVPLAGAQSTTVTSTPEPSGNAGNESIAPGERLAGVVGVGEAEVAGELEGRAFGFAMARAATNNSRAVIVARQVEDLDRRLERLRDRKQRLDAAHANGSISDGRYRAETAEVVAQIRTTERLTNRTENASRGIPAELLEANGVNATAIMTLKRNARNLTGPEVAAIARSIAGPRAGRGIGRGPPPGVIGPPPGVGPGRSTDNATSGVPGNATSGPGPGPVEPPGRANGSENETSGGPDNATRGGPPDAPRGPSDDRGNRSAGPNRGGRGR